jgi:hypothetical protein
MHARYQDLKTGPEGRSIPDLIMHACTLLFIHVLFVVVYWLDFDLPVHDVDLRVRIVHFQKEFFRAR